MAKKQNRRARAKKTALSAEQRIINAHVEPAAQAHGDFAVEAVAGEAVFRGGRAEATSRQVIRNRGGTTIERWAARGDLSDAQTRAIATYARAWRLWIGERRVTANWNLAGSPGPGADPDSFAATRLAAKDLLKRLDTQVFFALPLHYFETWRNVVIHDEAAGTAGSRLGYVNARAEAAAKAIVLMIADMIAVELRLA